MTSVTSSVNPSTAGQNVTFTATVGILSPAVGVLITPAGTVSFFDGNTLVAKAPLSACLVLVSRCTATLKTSALPPGSSVITAKYSGDVLLTGSQASLVQVVKSPATTTTITLGSNTVASKASDPFTISVTAAGGVPTGLVTLTLTPAGNPGGIATYGPFPLTNGSFTSSLSITNKATYSVVATYGGSTVNIPSTSATVTLVVN
ncbi:MAG TPA: Ig-like domain-containing protein [Acidimicrobiales bacterium]|nr:Ig-like domain-containing protein [Acidimicrobiales bacterium]